MNNLIRNLALDPEFYNSWFGSATDTQKEMLWSDVWDQAALKASESQFVNDLYNFYNLKGYLTQKQFYFLILNVNPPLLKFHPLKDRLKDRSC